MNDGEMLEVFMFGVQLVEHLNGTSVEPGDFINSLTQIADGELIIVPTHAERRLRLSKELPEERIQKIPPFNWQELRDGHKAIASRIVEMFDDGSTDG